MTDFRKWFFALVALAVLVGITADTAAAQAFQCTANAGVPARVRGEGRTELVGDLILNCQGVVPSALTANIQIFLSTNITSRITNTTTGATEALLTLGDPSPLAAAPVTQVLGSNVFQGVKAGDNSLLWTNIPIIAPPGTTQIIRITNVRANASQAFSQGQTFIPQQITMFVTVTSSTAIPINNPTQVVGAVLKGLDFALRNCKDDGGGSSTYSQCSSSNSDLYGDATNTGAALQGLLKFTEGFDAAFKIRITPGQNGAPLGTFNANSESGYVNGSALVGVAPVTGASQVLGDVIGVANSGTRLIARFAGIPAGVKMFVTAVADPAGTATHPNATSSTVKAVLVSVTDPTGTGGSASFPVGPTGKAACGSGSDMGAKGIVEVPLFGGAGAATWEITASSGSAVETAAFGVAVAYSASPSSNIPALTLGVPGTVGGNFAPVSSDDKMSATSPIPRFADLPISTSLLEVNPCVTNLLFPFVSARGGFDTGMAISNTTLDNSKNLPGGTNKQPYNSSAQNGACTLYYFGDKEDGTSLAKPIQTSGVINAGKQLVYTLFGGGAGIDATPGFQGYIIATCNFQLAHGFAFISDLGAQKLALGYLALVLNRDNASARSGRLEALDN
jgi:hypothetical protein